MRAETEKNVFSKNAQLKKLGNTFPDLNYCDEDGDAFICSGIFSLGCRSFRTGVSWILRILNLRLKFAAACLASFADKLSQDTEDPRPRGLLTFAYPELLIACHSSKQYFFAFHFPTEPFSLFFLSLVIANDMG